MRNKLALIALIFFMQGCTIGHQEFYSQVAPMKYPPTDSVRIFTYSDVDLNKIYDTFFSDLLIIGKTSFNGPYEDPTRSEEFAKSLGAHIFITSVQYSNTTSSNVPITTPTVSTTNMSGYAGRTSFSGSATTYGTQTSYIPISVNRYTQKGIYLRNMNDKKPVWDKNKSDYKCDSEVSEFTGLWKNEKYEISVCKSVGKYVGFITNDTVTDKAWNIDDVKFEFGSTDNFGVYFMGDKTPLPANFKINKFGHLEVSAVGQNAFTFAKK